MTEEYVSSNEGRACENGMVSVLCTCLKVLRHGLHDDLHGAQVWTKSRWGLCCYDVHVLTPKTAGILFDLVVGNTIVCVLLSSLKVSLGVSDKTMSSHRSRF